MENVMKKKNVKGFTLVELIVVMVILAILAALLIPGLTRYIDKANSQSVIVEARSVAVATQTIISEHYGKSKPGSEGREDSGLIAYINGTGKAQILELAELPTGVTLTFDNDAVVNAKLQKFTYSNGAYTVVYDVTADELYTVTEGTPTTPSDGN